MTEPLMELTEFEEFRTGDPQRLLDAATQEVRSYCGWHIAPEVTTTVTVEGSGAALLLPTLRLTGITSITQNDSVVALENLTWKPNGIVTGYVFNGDFEVTFTHGYETTPDDIARVVSAVTADGLEGLRRVQSWARGPFSETYDATGASADQAILDRYRISSRP